jgi:hypothetical protein
MISGAFRLMLVAGLVAGLLAGALATASAGPPAGPDCLFFPWVPNGVEIEDPDTSEVSGPYYGALRIQNLENEQISVYVMPFDHCDTANPGVYYQMGISANAAIAFGVNEFIPEGTGGGLAIVGRLASDSSQPARIAGVQRQSSPTPLSSSIFSINTHETVSGYSALSEVGVAGQVYLPIVQTNNNWNTLVRATNFDRFNNANIHITLREAASGDILGPFFHLTGPGETATFDLRALNAVDLIAVYWAGDAIAHYNWLSFGWKESLAGRFIVLESDSAYCGGGYTPERWRGLGIHTEVNAAMLEHSPMTGSPQVPEGTQERRAGRSQSGTDNPEAGSAHDER